MKKILTVILIIFASCSIAHNNHNKPCCGGCKNKQAKFKAIIFDCDGVLVDSEQLKFTAWRKAFNKYKQNLSLEEYKPLIGNSSNHILSMLKQQKNLNLKGKDKQIISYKNKVYTDLQKKQLKVMPDAVKFAKNLALNKNQLGIKIGLASSAPKSEIKFNIAKAGLSTAFDAIISGHDDLQDIQDIKGTNKPKPYIYQRIAIWLGVKPEECLVLEDTASGVNAAKAAGMTVYAVPNAFTKGQDFSNANKIINNFNDNTLKLNG